MPYWSSTALDGRSGPQRRAGDAGSNNSAHDICRALYENDVDVTMVQRSSTHVVKSDSLMELGLGDLYSERAVATGMPTEKADLTFAAGKVWGLGSGTAKDPGPWEGEQHNMWKPTQQDNLWFHGGNLHQSRHYSLYLALQLKARYEGLATPVYGLQEVHHLS